MGGAWTARRAGACFLCALGISVGFAASVQAQAEYPVAIPARVTGVIDGDTVDAQLADGRTVRVRLIGIDAPSFRKPTECGGREARNYLRLLLQDRDVVLIPDQTQGQVDGAGRSLFYVDRSDGLDTGLAMLRSGWADLYLVDDVAFERYDSYSDASDRAVEARRGVFKRCAGDFHLSRQDQLRRSATAFVRRYYSLISHRRFLRAWRMLGPGLRRRNGSFNRWKAGYGLSLGTTVRSARARLSGRRAVVTVSLRSRDRDACNGRVIRQSFRGSLVLARRGSSWVAVKARLRKTGGGHVRTSKSECPKPKPRPRRRPPTTNCQGYDPCLPPGSDVDCAGGSGNGPRYVEGPVTVTGSDPYDLDRDGDGTACES
jgi:endonuclease YncB( thermonuclease family)